MKDYWWQEAIIYQIYLRSFFDGNSDGIGDFKGLIKKLDYLDDLGVDALWVSPHYESPMDDNGYDVSDYYKVSKDYGTIEDVKEFIKEAHKRDIKVLFDLVLNHTSDEHKWFQAAKDPTHKDHEKYHDYYIWQSPKYDDEGNKKPPTQWRSWFGGGVWEYNEPTDEYYLHIFSKKMPDLNWRNASMKRDLKNITKWWIDLGVDGFRVDASNHLEKNWKFPEAHPGYEHFSSLPKHHDYLEEFGKELFIPNNILTIGESGGASQEEALQYAGFDSKEFDLLIQFGHCWADSDDSNKLTEGKWAKGHLYVKDIKNSFQRWNDMLKDKGWNLIYWHNHDQPRVISHYGDDNIYHNISGKMLCQSLYFMPGTPIIYQGEEIGMTNVDYKNLHNFRDVEVFTEYNNFKQNLTPEPIAMQALRDRARDNARTPMQWDNTIHAGFSDKTPWINVVGNYRQINVQKESQDTNSILNTYKKVIRLRKELNVAFGNLEFIDIDNDDSYIYKNELADKIILSISNFRGKHIGVNFDFDISGYSLLMSNYKAQVLAEKMLLKPYESLVYIKNKEV
ncbi:MAG: alpha-glucosidase [Candidatus Izimaplasma sp.]|nr:alpha-glucosidase [Candidatus Izimaplasma bacterium]